MKHLIRSVTREAMADGVAPGAHEAAANSFVERVRSRHSDAIVNLYIFGSTARGEAQGRASDVDVLLVLADEATDDVREALRNIAYDVMLEHGPVVELHLLSESTFSRRLDEGHPFVRTVVREGQSHV